MEGAAVAVVVLLVVGLEEEGAEDVYLPAY